MVAIVGLAAPFFIAPLIDRSHRSYTPLGLGIGFALSLAFGTWRLIDTLSRLDAVDAGSRGFAFQSFLVAVGSLAATAVAGFLLVLGVVIGGFLGRHLKGPAA